MRRNLPFFVSSPLFRPVAAATPDLYQELSTPFQHFASPSNDSTVGQNLKLTDWESPERSITTERTKKKTEGLRHLLPAAQQLPDSHEDTSLFSDFRQRHEAASSTNAIRSQWLHLENVLNGTAPAVGAADAVAALHAADAAAAADPVDAAAADAAAAVAPPAEVQLKEPSMWGVGSSILQLNETAAAADTAAAATAAAATQTAATATAATAAAAAAAVGDMPAAAMWDSGANTGLQSRVIWPLPETGNGTTAQTNRMAFVDSDAAAEKQLLLHACDTAAAATNPQDQTLRNLREQQKHQDDPKGLSENLLVERRAPASAADQILQQRAAAAAAAVAAAAAAGYPHVLIGVVLADGSVWGVDDLREGLLQSRQQTFLLQEQHPLNEQRQQQQQHQRQQNLQLRLQQHQRQLLQQQQLEPSFFHTLLPEQMQQPPVN
ncbi:hypothetical protein, conserved [Eimeria tenella]|uniref:Uncharacterized protein n=1 Tax=Eimeria tenella TaxID=5802 RepID=U6KV50_EIMTE|nr:hypothetical protein, conserved [Eimeria tenella]CDJ39385.1 hypothetical protein, conserved [Eimeria tenella]|eukprot:XP_013230140.1 hypothetical protein, conserved [Eimeria tenella]